MPPRPPLSNSSSALIVIPARLSSQRLPRKMLLTDTGKPLVQHTWEAACRATRAGQVVVATDCEEIASTVTAFGGTAVITSPTAPSGTARIVETLPQFPDAKVVVNVQGDEPEIAPEAIDLAINLLSRCPEAGIATLVTPLRSQADLSDQSAVKAVLTPWRERSAAGKWTGPDVAEAWRAITFSRAPVPAVRDWSESLLNASPPLFWQHVGLYAYRRDVLEEWNQLPESRLAMLESLEQLQAVEAGIPIVAGAIDHAARGIDTLKDYTAFVTRNKSRTTNERL